jgi:serine phosphatase RsbU (regulator of sigma subunit)/DNA-binding response OmpR family regulator
VIHSRERDGKYGGSAGDARAREGRERGAGRRHGPRQAWRRPEAPADDGESTDDRLKLDPDQPVVLVIDSDSQRAAAVMDMVRARGASVIVARRATAALGLAREHRPRAVLLTGDTPRAESVLTQLKKHPDTRHIPVVLIGRDASRIAALRAGAAGFLAEPLRAEQLEETFERLERMTSAPARIALVAEPDEIDDELAELISGDRVALERIDPSAGQEAIAERLGKLQTLAEATESRSLGELLPRLAVRLAELFSAELVEVTIEDELLDAPLIIRVAAGRVLGEDDESPPASGTMHEVPLAIERLSVGTLRLWLGGRRSFSAAERSLLEDAADRAALAIRRARLHEEEHRIAVELQRGLVPKRLPRVDGLEISAHYQPAGAVAEVGGDWYDAFALAGGRLGVVVGDVAGKGIPAASTMGQLRSVTRAYALADEGRRLPGEVLTRLNSYQTQHGEGELFTVLYAIVDPREAAVTWTSAGHLPPLLRQGGGATTYVERGDGLIGLEQVEYTDVRRELSPGGLLILYTDGLVERRGESLDQGLTRLEEAASSGPDDPQQLCDHILDRLLPEEGSHDDVTAVVVKVS